jgi:hypothetical protein
LFVQFELHLLFNIIGSSPAHVSKKI